MVGVSVLGGRDGGDRVRGDAGVGALGGRGEGVVGLSTAPTPLARGVVVVQRRELPDGGRGANSALPRGRGAGGQLAETLHGTRWQRREIILDNREERQSTLKKAFSDAEHHYIHTAAEIPYSQ